MDVVRTGRVGLALAGLGVGLLAACSDPQPEALTIAWTERPLPAPAGAPGRTVVRDAVPCGEGWLRQTDDGRAWQRVDVPLSPQTAGDHTLMAAAGEDLLVVADAGDGGHVWSGQISP